MGIMTIFQTLSVGASVRLLVLTAVICYALGCLNGAVIISRFILKDDVRKHGSGNAGLTNFQRTYGGKLTLVVTAVDVIKMVAAVLITCAIFRVALPEGVLPVFVRYWAGIFCVLGHMFPVTFHFKGGKGILSGGTLTLLVGWKIAVCALGLFLIAVILTRYVSLGSCLATVAFCISSILVFHTPSVSIASFFVAVLVIWKHRSNIGRLMRGEESKFSLHGKKAKV